MRRTLFLALTLITIASSLPSIAADGPPPLPLAELKLGSGETAKIETTKDGLRVTNAAAILARVLSAADAFLCRTAAGANADVVQLSIGRAPSLRCNAVYSPSRDEAITFEGPRIELTWQDGQFRVDAQGPLTVRVDRDYMKTKRGLKYFRPLDKSVFSRAPAGWCSWYIFSQNVREDQVVWNTDWLAANLKEFGCQVVRLPDFTLR